MKPKYIEERLRSYFIFGENGKFVDLNNGNEDVVTLISKHEAQRLIDDRKEVLDLIFKFNELYPKEFEICYKQIINQ